LPGAEQGVFDAAGSHVSESDRRISTCLRVGIAKGRHEDSDGVFGTAPGRDPSHGARDAGAARSLSTIQSRAKNGQGGRSNAPDRSLGSLGERVIGHQVHESIDVAHARREAGVLHALAERSRGVPFAS
jgi:hypothetical protein